MGYAQMTKAALIAELEARDARKDRASSPAISLDEARAASGKTSPCGRTFLTDKGLAGHLEWAGGPDRDAKATGNGHGPR